MNFTKRFSIAHPEKDMENYPNHFYLILKNTPSSILNEIEDIYFGKIFIIRLGDNESFLAMLWGRKQPMNT